jgi:hypothetical protein
MSADFLSTVCYVADNVTRVAVQQMLLLMACPFRNGVINGYE